MAFFESYCSHKDAFLMLYKLYSLLVWIKNFGVNSDIEIYDRKKLHNIEHWTQPYIRKFQPNLLYAEL